MTFEALPSTNRSQAVRDQILEAITAKRFAPGDKLPSESKLGDSLGVSRVSIREAMRSLQAIGMVEIQQGRGSFVAEGPRDRYRTPFAEWLEVHREEVLELMKVRGALDELAAAEAAHCADETQVAAISEAHDAFSRAVRDEAATIDDLIDADVGFHLAIARASGSELLVHLLADLNKLFVESRHALFAVSGRASCSVREHEVVVEAIGSGHSENARSAAARHLQSTRDTLADDHLFTHDDEEQSS